MISIGPAGSPRGSHPGITRSMGFGTAEGISIALLDARVGNTVVYAGRSIALVGDRL